MNQGSHDPSHVSPPTTVTRAGQTQDSGSAAFPSKRDADYVFYELTRSICPECRRVIDAHILLRDNKVYLRKRYPEHGVFEGLVYSDAQAYTANARFNFAQAKALAKSAAAAIQAGKFGYAVIIATRPEEQSDPTQGGR